MQRFNKQLLLSFLVIVATAAFAIILGARYRIGTLSHMGPGFFPVMIGVLMVITGVILLLSGEQADTDDEAVEQAANAGDDDAQAPPVTTSVREAARIFFIIFVSVVGFIVLGSQFGLVPGTFFLCFVATFADRENTVINALILSTVLTLLCVAVFNWFLKIPFPLFGAL